MAATRRRLPVQLVAVACGAAVAIVLGWAGYDGDRVGLVAAAAVAAASGLHQALVALGERQADRARAAAPSSGGRGREHHFWPFVAGVLLFAGAAAGAGFVAGAAVDPDPGTALAGAALAAAGVLTAARLGVAVRAANRERGRAGWPRYLRRAPSPVVPIALVEAVAVLAAVLAAAAALAAVALGDDDPGGSLAVDAERAAAVAIAVVAAVTALVLLALVRPLVVGTSATGRDLEVVEAALAVDPSVLEVLDLRTRNVGPDDLLVAARVRLDHELTFPEATEVVARVRRNLRHALPAARAVFVEVDVGDEWRAAPVVVAEHEPDHVVPDDVRERLAAPGPGSLGHGIPLERDAS